MPPEDEINPAGSAGAARPGGVQSLHRALDVLETVASRGGTLTIVEIAEVTGIPLPTVHRLLRTLVERGYMRQTPDRRYALGLRLAPLAASAGSMVGAGTERVLGSLVDELGETANLAVLDGDRVVYVAQVPGRHAMRMFTEVGRRVHPHCTAVGKALLANSSDRDVRALLARTGLPRHTDRTVTDVEAFLGELVQVREQGYAVDEGEQEVGVRCVAVAPPEVVLPLGLSVSGPEPRMTDDLVTRAVPLLRSAAHRLLADLT